MSSEDNELGKIERVATTQKIEEVNQALSNGWMIIKTCEDVVPLDDGGKTTYITYHLGKPRKIPT